MPPNKCRLQPGSLCSNSVSSLFASLLLLLLLVFLIFAVITVRVVQNLAQIISKLHNVTPIVIIIWSCLIELQQLLSSENRPITTSFRNTLQIICPTFLPTTVSSGRCCRCASSSRRREMRSCSPSRKDEESRVRSPSGNRGPLSSSWTWTQQI